MPWAPDYVAEEDLIDFVRANEGNPYVGTYGTAASRAVDDFCNRQFGQLAAAATFTYPTFGAGQLPDGRWLLHIDDVQDITGMTVTIDGATIAQGVDGYRLWPLNEIAQGRPATALLLADRPCGDAEVLAKFGWTATPASVTGAVWLQVNRWNIRRESPYGTAGAPSEGSEVRLSARLDPDVRTLLSGRGIIRARMPG